MVEDATSITAHVSIDPTAINRARLLTEAIALGIEEHEHDFDDEDAAAVMEMLTDGLSSYLMDHTRVEQ